MAKPSRASRKATARPMPPEAPVMRAVLVGELVMRDLLSWFGVASPRARAVFVAPASSRPCPADQHERVETACNLVDGWHAVTPRLCHGAGASLCSTACAPRWEGEAGCMPGIIPSPHSDAGARGPL